MLIHSLRYDVEGAFREGDALVRVRGESHQRSGGANLDIDAAICSRLAHKLKTGVNPRNQCEAAGRVRRGTVGIISDARDDFSWTHRRLNAPHSNPH